MNVLVRKSFHIGHLAIKSACSEDMRLTGWRYGVFVGGFFGLIGVLCYTTMIRPMINPEPYKKIREQALSSQRST